MNLVEDCSADEIAPTYARLVSELQRGDYKLLDTWKKQQYQKAIYWLSMPIDFIGSAFLSKSPSPERSKAFFCSGEGSMFCK